MTIQEIAAMLREDIALTQRVVDGTTPDLGLKTVGVELMRHLSFAADALEE